MSLGLLGHKEMGDKVQTFLRTHSSQRIPTYLALFGGSSAVCLEELLATLVVVGRCRRRAVFYLIVDNKEDSAECVANSGR